MRQSDRAVPGQDARRRDAAVNLATEVATIRYRPDVASRADLVGAIEAAGYDLKPTAGPSATDADAIPQPSTRSGCRGRRARPGAAPAGVQAGVSIGVAIGIMIAMFWPQTAVPLETINRLVLLPATFIQVWAGGRFYRAAWRALRHGSANMDTLVAAGTSAAWLYSVVVTLVPEVVVRRRA